MHQGARNRTLDSLRRGSVKILIATDVAARGIDVPSITHVFNYDLPKFPEDYVHRIGRTGRAGRNGHAISLVNHAEGMNVKRIERFTKQLIPVNVVEGYEPKKTASAPRSSARPGGWKPGDNRGGAKPGQRSFSKPGSSAGAPRREGSATGEGYKGGGYKGSNPRSNDGQRRTYGDR
jgi:superfamily II DNA/RNA helicase